jgi:hypothetical protein
MVRYKILISSQNSGILSYVSQVFEGTAGDHKGQPSRSTPPSPLRTDEHVSDKPIREGIEGQPLLQNIESDEHRAERIATHGRITVLTILFPLDRSNRPFDPMA